MVTAPRLWPGETVAILATGPSLTAADVDRCRGRVRVIAVNDAHTLAPWADVLYSSDRLWWRYHHGVPTFTGLRFGIALGGSRRKDLTDHPEVTVLDNTGVQGLERSRDGLRSGCNSGYAAINLAVHLGAARILLLGYDMTAARGEHFFGPHPADLPKTTPQHWIEWVMHYPTLVRPLLMMGVEVVNCTPLSALTCFEKSTIDAVLGPVPHEAVA